MDGSKKRKAVSPLLSKRTRRLAFKTRFSSGTKRQDTKRQQGTKRQDTKRQQGTKRQGTKRQGTKRQGTKRRTVIRTSGTMTRGQSKTANAAAAKISQFFKKNKYSRKANYLKTVHRNLCADAGVCLAIGSLALVIKEHFNGFTAFDYVDAPIKKIGEESANGFINQINYTHRGYKACALLKSSKTEDSDNLLYEYVVGQYINRMNKHYPCFLETYGYYMYLNEATWIEMQTNPLIQDVSLLKNGLLLQKSINYDDACRESRNLAILIQYFQGIQSLQKMSLDPTFIQNELMGALFQLYAPLAKMKNTFTHYDLHLENVYLYKPAEGSYIEYHYYISSTRAITFKSSYMVKIIDYGRSFFKDEMTGLNSKTIYEEELCDNAMECNEPEEVTGECGSKVGFSWLKKLSATPLNSFYISSQKRNMSHDLLPLTRIAENHTTDNQLTPELNALVKKVIYTSYFGTAEIVDRGYPHAIYNVQDAADSIADYLMSNKFVKQNEMVYTGKEKLGDLHIYTDGKPMRFEPVATNSA
jgi:hypothetical protein